MQHLALSKRKSYRHQRKHRLHPLQRLPRLPLPSLSMQIITTSTGQRITTMNCRISTIGASKPSRRILHLSLTSSKLPPFTHSLFPHLSHPTPSYWIDQSIVERNLHPPNLLPLFHHRRLSLSSPNLRNLQQDYSNLREQLLFLLHRIYRNNLPLISNLDHNRIRPLKLLSPMVLANRTGVTQAVPVLLYLRN